MERKNLGYSMKNIPIPSKASYMKRMMEQVEKFVRRIRWKALFFEKPELMGKRKNTYGFKTNLAPPRMEHLEDFETDLYNLVSNVQYSSHRNEFQRKLAQDVKEINSSSNLLVPADKTTNLYSMSREAYQKLLSNNITKSYKRQEVSPPSSKLLTA